MHNQVNDEAVHQPSPSKDLAVWQFVLAALEGGQDVMMLWVVASTGSSPGRQGFKLVVAADGKFYGTIGGGIMEHKLVEKAKAGLLAHEKNIKLVTQHHDKKIAKDQSGMICSGSQTIAFVPISIAQLEVVKTILSSAPFPQAVIHLSPLGITWKETDSTGFHFVTHTNWSYIEAIDQRPVIHIIGGGHVSLALSEIMTFLNFYIHVYDDRSTLNTLELNRFAHQKHLINYNTISNDIKANEKDYVVIVSFGYRHDKIILKQLLEKKVFYLGLMGSTAKINTLLSELEKEGINPEKWKHCFAPIGINIHSQTAQEIAISIAAEIIREKNLTPRPPLQRS